MSLHTATLQKESSGFPQKKADKVFFPNLDGLRFFAFLSVFLSHTIGFMAYHDNSTLYTAINHFFKHGDLGVNFFFVLSGFLITFLLLKETESQGTIRVPYFYLRRILRIWPVYFMVIFLGFFIVPSLASVMQTAAALNIPAMADLERLPWYAFFLANFDFISHRNISIVVVILWSVSVEEQFYLVWPLLLNRIKIKKADRLFLIIIAAAFIYRCIYSGDRSVLRYSTFSVMSDLAIGAMTAYHTLYSPGFISRFTRLKKGHVAMVYLAGLLLVSLRGFSHIFGEQVFRLYIPFESLIFSAFFVFIILEQNFCPNSLFKAGRSGIISYLGRISYGLYCYHTLAILLCLTVLTYFEFPLNNFPAFLTGTVLSFGLTVLLAFVSYLAMEKRLINFKENFSLFREQALKK